MDEVDKYILIVNRKLSNKQFVSKAPKEVVQKEKDRIEELKEKKNKLRENLSAVS